MRPIFRFAAALPPALLAPLCAALAPVAALATTPAPRPPRPPLAQACAGRDGWTDPAPPQRLVGNTWYVGTCGITVLLVTSAKGHVLLDGGTPAAAPLVLASIRAAGFDPRDVRWIVSSHEHIDHAGALAALKAATGARLAAMPAAARTLESGAVPRGDPQAAGLDPSPRVGVDRLLADGAVIAVGPLRLVAHATPGHAPGSTSWTWQSCAQGHCRAMAYVDSVSALAAGGWRFSDHPAYVATFRRSLARIAALPCDTLATPHPGASDLFERAAAGTLAADRGACRAYSARGRQRLDETLAKEAAAPQRPAP